VRRLIVSLYWESDTWRQERRRKHNDRGTRHATSYGFPWFNKKKRRRHQRNTHTFKTSSKHGRHIDGSKGTVRAVCAPYRLWPFLARRLSNGFRHPHPPPTLPPPHPTLPVFQMLLRLMNGAFSFSHAQARSLHRVRACVRLAIFRVSHCHWVCTQGLVRWFTRDAVKDETPNSLRQTVQKEEEERLLCLSKDTRSIRRQLKRF